VPSDLDSHRGGTGVKRKANGHEYLVESSTVLDQQDNKRIRSVKTPTKLEAIVPVVVEVKSEPVVPPVKRKQGRPRKDAIPIVPVSEIKAEPKQK
jgi:hypothetical protein